MITEKDRGGVSGAGCLLGEAPARPQSAAASGAGQLRRFLSRIAPISQDFGFDRGTPIYRHYVEDFLTRNSGDIKGRVLEVGDDAYNVLLRRRVGSRNGTCSTSMRVRRAPPSSATCPSPEPCRRRPSIACC